MLVCFVNTTIKDSILVISQVKFQVNNLKGDGFRPENFENIIFRIEVGPKFPPSGPTFWLGL